MKRRSGHPGIIVFLLLCTALPIDAQRRHADIQNIGNRKLSGRVFGFLPNMISMEKELALGTAIAKDFEQTAVMIEDPAVTDYVDGLGQILVKHSDAKIPFHIRVVDTEEVNAFAFPGGHFYVNKGLLLMLENEAELAGVMAHEIAHVCARHYTRSLSKLQYLEFAGIPASFVGGSLAQLGIQTVLGFGQNLEILSVSRGSEKEADQLGIQYVWDAGYDPSAIVSFFERLQSQEKNKPGRFAGWFRTHPFVNDRILASINEQRFLPDKDSYIIDSSEFQKVKSRLLAQYSAEERERWTTGNPPDPKKPVLKRNPGNSGEDSGKEPDDQEKTKKNRPVLKRP